MSVVEKGANIARESCEKPNSKDFSRNGSKEIIMQKNKDQYAGKAVKKHAKTAIVPPLQRQGTFTRTCYRYRKSISQIDMKLARRSGFLNFSPAHKKRLNGHQIDGQTEIVSHDDQEDLRLAGMRVYVTFMKNAWRRRRDETKTLTNVIMELRKDNALMKNQLHLFKSLFYAEKSTNDELTQHLKMTTDQIHSLEETQKRLEATNAQLEKKRMNTEQQLMIKIQDHHALNVFFKQTKTELFEVMSELQDIRSKLDTEESKVQQLETEKHQLIKNFEILCEHTQAEVDDLQHKLLGKDDQIKAMHSRHETELNNSKECFFRQICDYNANELKLRQELDEAEEELKVLRHCLAATMGQRIQKCWKNAFLVHRATFHVIHWFAYGLLPALPPPMVSNPFPLNFTLEKAMSIMKR